MIKKILFLAILVLVSIVGYGQAVNVQNVTVTGRFNTCTASNNEPTVTMSLVAGTGVSIQNGNLACIDPCGTTTLRINISGAKWDQSPGAEWLHGLFFPVNAGYTLSGINLPPGFITNNTGCTGQCPSGIVAGPGFYFDGTGGNACCGSIMPNDALPCNNFGDVSLNCATPFSFFFDLTFCNTKLTGNSETFTLTGTSDGATGCWSNNNNIQGSISFTVNTSPCPVNNAVPFTFSPVHKSCVGVPAPNYIVDVSGGCGNSNVISWWTDSVGGTLLGTGSPFTYDPPGSACPVGDTIYASCCALGATTCIIRTPVIIQGVCDSMEIDNVYQPSFTCNGLGTIDSTTVFSPFGPVSYTLTPGNITNGTGSYTNLAAGAYTITAVDGGGCVSATTVNIVPLPQLQISNIASVSATCVPGNDGSIVATATGGTLGYQYSVGGAFQASNSFSTLGSGIYSVVVQDANGCADTTSVNLTPPNAPNFASVTSTLVSCSGGSNGTLQVNSGGGTAPLSYNLQPGNITNGTGQFTNLSAGNYTITVTDAVNCSASTIKNVAQPAPFGFYNLLKNNVSCHGAADGNVQLNTNGGVGAPTFLFNPGNINTTNGYFSNLAPGTYNVVASDANNCTATTNIVITQPALITFGTPVIVNPGCIGVGNGSITVVANNGIGVNTYSIQPGSATNTNGVFTGLLGGNYVITVTDSKGCTASTTATLVSPPILQITNVAVIIPTCVPNNDGQISITTSGGTAPNQYTIGGANQPSSVFNNVASGIYTVTVLDASGCTVSTIVNLLPPVSPSVSSVVSTPVTCPGGSDGTLQATASGGAVPYNYTLLPANITNTSGLFTNLAAGNYSISVADASSCSITSGAVVPTPPPFSWANSVINNVSCNGGSDGSLQMSLNGGTGPYTFTLMPGNITNATGIFSNLAPNTYTISAIDSKNCTGSTVVTIAQPNALQWGILQKNNVRCFGGYDGSFFLTASGGTGSKSYNLQPGNINNSTGLFTSLVQGTYVVTVKDAKNCTLTSSVTIFQPTVLQLANISNVPPSCVPGNDGSITINATGGSTPYLYNIGGPGQGSNVFSNLGNGSYVITVVDAKNCSVSSAVNVAPPNAPVINNVTVNTPNCYGDSSGNIQINSSGGVAPYSFSISPGSVSNTTGIFNNLPANTYTVTVTDATSCSVTSTVSITQPSPQIWGNSTITNVNCNGGSNGSFQISTSGGFGVITYLLSPGNVSNTTGSFSNLTAFPYTITATDANGCSQTSTVTISEPPALQWNPPIIVNAGCHGANDGGITLTAMGGAPSLSYTLQPGNLTNSTGIFTGLVQGSYTITVTDANNCTLASTISISHPPLLQVTNVAVNSPSCVPGNDGSMTITVAGGTPIYLYTIGVANQTSNIFNNVGVGNYSITITDANGCKAATFLTVAPPNAPIISSIGLTNVACNGGSNGSLQVNATSGAAPLSYNLMPGNISNGSGLFTSLSIGTYNIVVTDALSCTFSSTATISQPTQVVWDSISQQNVSCNAGADASIHAAASGGTGVISYNLIPGNVTNTTGIFTALSAQLYTITATDANNCSITTTVTIAQPTPLVWGNLSTTSVSCNGGNNESLSLTASGGTPSLSYNLQPGNITNSSGTFTSLTQGIYTVTVTDANNCTMSSAVTITQPTALQITNISTTSPSCVPGNDGSITVTAAGGTTTYQYNIGGTNQASNIFNNVGSGIYTVTVTDANNCTATTSVNVSAPNAPSITNVVTTPVSCNGGSNGNITLTASGGTSPLGYNLMPGNVSNATGVFSNLIAGAYTVTVSDAIGCTVSSLINISQPTQVIWDSMSQQNVSCNAGADASIQAAASGGTGVISYNLNPGNVTNTTGIFTALNAQLYTITATDANNCSITTTVTIAQPTPLVWGNLSTTSVSCNGGNNGSLSLTASGGTPSLSYNLQPGNITNSSGTFTTLTQGIYTVTVTDANNCTMSSAVTITQPTALQITNISTTSPSCVPGNDGSITVTASDGTTTYQYSIGGTNQASNTFNNVGSGIYIVTVTDANNCTATTSVNVSAPNAPSITNVVTTPVSCNGGSNGNITLTASGGTSPLGYNLMPGNVSNATGVFSNLIAGAYTVTVSDAIGCTVSSLINISQPTQVIWDSMSQQNVSCNAGADASIQAAASGGTGVISYNLNPGNVTNTTGIFTALNAQLYTITATDVNNCSITTTVTIAQPTPLVWGNLSTTSVSCNGGNNGSLSLTASGGTPSLSYNLQPGNITNSSGTFTTLTQGIYTVTVTDANNCTMSSAVPITQPTALQITNISTTSPSCVPGNDGSITVTASGGTTTYQYNIGGTNQASNIFNNVGSGIYTVTVTDANNCTATTSVSILAPNTPVISNLVTTAASCAPGNDATITVTGTNGQTPYQYNIGGANQASNIFTGVGIGTYIVTVTDAVGCTGTSATSIVNPPAPIITNTATTMASCNPGCDGSVNISASGGTNPTYTYSINGTTFHASNTFNNMCTNNYIATVMDGNGCTDTALFAITTVNGPVLSSVSIDSVSCNGGTDGSITLNVTGGANPLNYNLQPINSTNTSGVFNNLGQGNYTATITDANGCVINTSLVVSQPLPLQFDSVVGSGSSCNGSSNGSIFVSNVGGTGQYSYTINPVASFTPPGTFSNLVGNTTYTITAADANNCTLSTSIFIASPATLVITNATITDVTCNGASNGAVQMAAAGGTMPYVFNLLPNNIPNASGSFTGLSGGLYSISVTDANNCTMVSTVTVFEPTAIQVANLSIQNITCFGDKDGSIQIVGSGGVAPLSYNLQPINQTNATGSWNNLSPANYFVTITDANSCTISTLTPVLEPGLLTIDSLSTVNVSCYGQADAQITTHTSGGNGGNSYLLLPINSTNTTGYFNTGLTAQQYIVVVTDSNKCQATDTVLITQPNELTASNTKTDLVCNGINTGAITVTPMGGTPSYTYTLQPGNIVNTSGAFSSLFAGTYSVTVTDANGCTTDISGIILTQPPAIQITSFAKEDVTCYGDSTGKISLTAIGGTGTLQYSIAPNAGSQSAIGVFENLYANNYIVTVSDANSCTHTSLVTIQQNAEIVFDKLILTTPLCHGNDNGAIRYTLSGGVGTLLNSFNNGPFDTITTYLNLTAGAYPISIVDVLNCRKDTTLLLTEPDSMAFVEIKPQYITCTGTKDGAVQITTTGGVGYHTYYIRPGVSFNRTGRFVDLDKGLYTIQVVDTNNCKLDSSFVISNNPDILKSTIVKQDLSCHGVGIEGEAEVNVMGGTPPYSYLWSTNPASTSKRVSDLRFGYYSVKITDAAGCERTDTTYINPGDCCTELFVPNSFSPNNDGNNDKFRVLSTAGIELEQFEIYNRWGQRVWQTNTYYDYWDGTFKGEPAPIATYYYIYRYICNTDNKEYVKKGDIILIR